MNASNRKHPLYTIPQPSRIKAVFFTLLLAGVVPACSQGSDTNPICRLAGKPVATLDSAKSTWSFVEKEQGPLEKLQKSGQVPNLQFNRLPKDLNALPNKRIDLFLGLVLPSALHVNAEIQKDRDQLLELSQKSNLNAKEKKKLSEWAQAYGLEEPSLPELLKRVDIVPVSLVLAQAADESGWGRSRFAIEGNALFGQHTNNPDQRSIAAKDADVRLAAFENLCGSVQAYIQNLNSTRAYAKFRDIRARVRQSGQALSGTVLVEGLAQYSQRGAAYLTDLRSIMNSHELATFDQAELVGPARWARVTQGDL